MLEELEFEDQTDMPELSEEYKLEIADDEDYSVFKRSIMGEIDIPCLNATIDDLDQYVAGCYSNGEIKLYDPHGGGLVKKLQKDSETTGLPITSIIKWRP